LPTGGVAGRATGRIDQRVAGIGRYRGSVEYLIERRDTETSPVGAAEHDRLPRPETERDLRIGRAAEAGIIVDPAGEDYVEAGQEREQGLGIGRLHRAVLG